MEYRIGAQIMHGWSDVISSAPKRVISQHLYSRARDMCRGVHANPQQLSSVADQQIGSGRIAPNRSTESNLPVRPSQGCRVETRAPPRPHPHGVLPAAAARGQVPPAGTPEREKRRHDATRACVGQRLAFLSRSRSAAGHSYEIWWSGAWPHQSWPKPWGRGALPTVLCAP
jgi:hypothetical protein